MCLKLPASTRAFTSVGPKLHGSYPCQEMYASLVCNDTDFMACPTNMSPRFCRRRRPKLRKAESSSHTSEVAQVCALCERERAWITVWALPHWMDSAWGRGREHLIPALYYIFFRRSA